MVFILRQSPFDSLDFASERMGLGGRMGIDATTKMPPESDRDWGEPLTSDPDVAAMVDRRWQEYGLDNLKLINADPSLFGYNI